ncbi:MAG TPA: PQQ-dependent sugar dehydrogenase [Pseudolabrys sp.]|nr:PQQ-dependent sugar dehydrogenase [Pseudolabrys sp.]
MNPAVRIALATVLALAVRGDALAADGPPAGSEAAARLKPIAAPAQPAAPDALPLSKLKLPAGFRIELYAAGIPDAHSLRVGAKGTVFVASPASGKVYAIDAQRAVKVVASGLHRPNGLALRDGTLFIAEVSRIVKIDNVEDVLDNPPAPQPVYEDLPKDEVNGLRFLGIGPDRKLYVSIGQPCNNCLPPPTAAQIRRIDLEGNVVEAVALGVRNSLGFDWSPQSRQLYFTDNGRDWLSEDAPSDELNRVAKPGENFGAPFCYQGNLPDTEFGWGHSCDEFTPPLTLLGPHVAPLGMRFYTGRMFPGDYRDAIFIARHGSWNRTKKLGGDIVLVRLGKNGSVASMEPFLTGFIADNNYLGRPVDVDVMRDGALLVSDDWNGAVYRVSYGREQAREPLRERRGGRFFDR